jgi:hypothetical protein
VTVIAPAKIGAYSRATEAAGNQAAALEAQAENANPVPFILD